MDHLTENHVDWSWDVPHVDTLAQELAIIQGEWQGSTCVVGKSPETETVSRVSSPCPNPAWEAWDDACEALIGTDMDIAIHIEDLHSHSMKVGEEHVEEEEERDDRDDGELASLLMQVQDGLHEQFVVLRELRRLITQQENHIKQYRSDLQAYEDAATCSVPRHSISFDWHGDDETVTHLLASTPSCL